jgi:hypothetical protein
MAGRHCDGGRPVTLAPAGRGSATRKKTTRRKPGGHEGALRAIRGFVCEYRSPVVVGCDLRLEQLAEF